MRRLPRRIRSGRQRGQIPSHRRSSACIPGKTIATGSCDGSIKLWDIETGRCKYTFEGHTNWVLMLAFSPDGKTISSGSNDGTIKLWNISQLDLIPQAFNWLIAKQWELLEAIWEAIRARGQVQATKDQWAVFQSLPKIIKDALRLYIRPSE